MARLIVWMLFAGATAWGASPCLAADPVRADSVHIRLIDQVEVPAQTAGALVELNVKEGQLVGAGDRLGRLDDADNRLAVDRARVDFKIAEQLAASELKLLLARNMTQDAQEAGKRAGLELEIASRKADNDVHVRYARKAAEVAAAEHERAVQSRKSFRDSVSQSEIDALRLTMEKATLEVEQAEHDLAIARLGKQVKQSETSSLLLNVEKRTLEFKQAEEERLIAALTRDAKAGDLAMAQHELDRRTIRSPLAGVVVQIHRHPGEWVQPEDKVLRIVRLDRLRAEGFVSFRDLRSNLADGNVVVSVSLPDSAAREFRGKIVFVSPEIDPVNGQVRIWAEVDNPQFVLRPGMKASMSIVSP